MKLLPLLLLANLALAQLEPRALDLLEKARQIHGGVAWDSLKTYRETAKYIYLSSAGQAQMVLEVRIRADFVGGRLRVEYLQDGKPTQIVQATPELAQSWTPQGNTIRLPPSQAKSLRDTLFQGWYGLRSGSKNRERTQLGNAKSLQGVVIGQEVKVQTKGAVATYYFASDGTLVGELDANEQLGDLLILYEDYRLTEGLKLPYRQRVFSGNDLFATIETLEIVLNPSFSDVDFKMP